MNEKIKEIIQRDSGRFIAALVLCAVTVVIIIFLSAAGKKETNIMTIELTGESAAETEQSTEAVSKAGFQSPIINLNGYKFTVLCSDENTRDDFGDAENKPEILKKALNERNAQVEAKTGITINAQTSQNALQAARNAYASGDYTVFDMLALKLNREISTLMQEGMLADLGNPLGIDLKSSRYSQSALAAFSKDGKVYAVTGSALWEDNAAASVLFFSKSAFDKLPCTTEELYGYVWQGVWTLDRMHQLSVEAKNAADPELPAYNTLVYMNPENAYEYLISSGARFFKMNSAGEAELTDHGPVKAIQSLLETGLDKECVTDKYEMKWSGTLFSYAKLGEADEETVQKYSLGVLPCPVYDEGIGYTSHISSDMAVFTAILKGNGNYGIIADVLELLYEASALKIDTAYSAGIGLRDPESLEMLKIINESASYDLLTVFGTSIVADATKEAYLKSDVALFSVLLDKCRTAAQWSYNYYLKQIFG